MEEKLTLPTIEALYNEALKKVKDHRDWYHRKAGYKKRASKSIRALAIIFVGLGTLCPLLDATQVLSDVNINLARWGYVFFGMAAIFVGFDKFFGVSSGWVRYIQAMLKIDKMTDQFKFEWNKKLIEFAITDLAKAQKIELIEMLRLFVQSASEVVENETANWAKEFESSLLELVKTAGNSKA